MKILSKERAIRREAPGLFSGYPEKRVLTLILILLFSLSLSTAANLNFGMMQSIHNFTLAEARNAVTIYPKYNALTIERRGLDEEDVVAIRKLKSVRNAFLPMLVFERQGEKSVIAETTSRDFFAIMGFKTQVGRIFREDIGHGETPEAVAASPESYSRMFGDLPLRLARVKIGGVEFAVSGILAPNLLTSSYLDSQNGSCFFVPASALQGKEKMIFNLLIDPRNRNAARDVVGLLKERHHDQEYRINDFNNEILRFKTMLVIPIRIAWLFVICTAVIAMLGITGMLVLALAERYPDLGRMRLLGATKLDVFKYIIINLMSASFVPAILGTSAGVYFALCLSRFCSTPFVLSLLLTPRLMLVFLTPFAFALIAAIGPTIQLLRKDPLSFYITR